MSRVKVEESVSKAFEAAANVIEAHERLLTEEMDRRQTTINELEKRADTCDAELAELREKFEDLVRQLEDK